MNAGYGQGQSQGFSGLGRYGSFRPYQSNPYQPRTYSPSMGYGSGSFGPTIRPPSMFAPPGSTTTTIPGMMDNMGGGATGNGVSGQPGGTAGQAGQIGMAGFMGGIPGLIGALGAAAANGASVNGAAVNAGLQGDPIAEANANAQAEAADSTNPSSVNAVNGMDAQSDAAGGGGSGK